MYNDENLYYPDPWGDCLVFKDYGPEPFVINIEKATLENNTFRTALWTGEYLQLTLMSIDVNDDIGFEVHNNLDQFIRIEQGKAFVMMGDTKDNMTFKRKITDDCIALIPAGKWHNVINVGCIPLKLYSIYAPPAHPHGTIHGTKDDDEHHDY
ncbi:MAG: cupin domain-containing protein [Tissierella sp.]|uniref:cupin domain-containing protein n=1 Tax=Tissierella sp. TaxID=41274 RepID=UPI003F9AFD31